MAIQHLQALKQGQCPAGGLAQVGTETGCYAKNDCTARWIGGRRTANEMPAGGLQPASCFLTAVCYEQPGMSLRSIVVSGTIAR